MSSCLPPVEWSTCWVMSKIPHRSSGVMVWTAGGHDIQTGFFHNSYLGCSPSLTDIHLWRASAVSASRHAAFRFVGKLVVVAVTQHNAQWLLTRQDIDCHSWFSWGRDGIVWAPRRHQRWKLLKRNRRFYVLFSFCVCARLHTAELFQHMNYLLHLNPNTSVLRTKLHLPPYFYFQDVNNRLFRWKIT